VVHDFYIYWFHRWQHSNRYLWRTHEAHHSVQNIDWLAGSRSHAVEIAINQTIEFMPMYLLGAAPAVLVYKALMDAVWGMYIHANLNVKTGWLQKIINGPEMHRWHHSTDVYDQNFATKIALWDWIFGSAHLPKDQKPTGYGLAEEDFPLVKEGEGELGGAVEFVKDKKDPLQLMTYIKQQLALVRPAPKKANP
jgi:sterol desaturase/sphingolipid hydroxylase (fatty acid hydroxylase superfamily)